MENLEMHLKEIQDNISSLEEQLREAQNTKLTTEVRLEKENETCEEAKKVLKNAIGTDDLDKAKEYIENKTQEMEQLLSDMSILSNQINSDYDFTDDDVNNLKMITERYNIPLENVQQ